MGSVHIDCFPLYHSPEFQYIFKQYNNRGMVNSKTKAKLNKIKRLPKTDSLERNQEIAGGLMSVTFIISSLLFPIIGVMVDKIGKRIYFLMLSSVLIISSFVLFLNMYPFVPLILLGIAYSFFGAVIWPTIAYLVEEKNLVLYNFLEEFFIWYI